MIGAISRHCSSWEHDITLLFDDRLPTTISDTSLQPALTSKACRPTSGAFLIALSNPCSRGWGPHPPSPEHRIASDPDEPTCEAEPARQERAIFADLHLQLRSAATREQYAIAPVERATACSRAAAAVDETCLTKLMTMEK
jgi:hypothetical protein